MKRNTVCERCGKTFTVTDQYVRKVCFDCKPYSPNMRGEKTPNLGETVRICAICGETKAIIQFRRGKRYFSECRSCHIQSIKDAKFRRWLALVDMLGGVCSVCGYEGSEKALKVKLPNGRALRFNALFRKGPRGKYTPQDGKLVCLNCLAEERDDGDTTD